MITTKLFSVLMDDEKNALFDEWKEQWHLQYFLDIAWLTGRHIDSIVQSENDLLFRRSSGVGHWVKGSGAFFMNQLALGPLLLHESLMPCDLDKTAFTTEKTSQLMAAKWGSYNAHPSSLSDIQEVQMTHMPRLTTLSIHDHVHVHNLYQTYMKGSLSVADFEKMTELGSYSVGYAIGEELVAVGHVGMVHEKKAFIYGILVRPDFRGVGLGRRIMNALHAEAHIRELDLFLLTNNPVAIDLYASLGYQSMGSMFKINIGSGD